jgi:ribosomal-protein-serine acetyltransferase
VRSIYWDLDDGVVIRTLTPDDAQELYALVDRNRTRLRPWMAWEPTTKGPADTRAFIERALASETDREANGIWVDHDIAGTIGLSVNLIDHRAELGYWLDGAAEGRGIITRACRRFMVFAFEELDLHRVELRAAVGNERSRAVAHRLGMVQEGVAREAGHVADGYVDLVSYGILRSEWRDEPASGHD